MKKNEKIRIMYLISSLGSGGAERQLVELAKNIDKEKYKPFIVIYRNIIHYKYILDVEGVSVTCIEMNRNPIFLPIFLWKLVKFIKENKIDIIHSYMPGSNLWGRLAGKLAGCKIVIPSIRNAKTPLIYQFRNYWPEYVLKNWTTCIISNSYKAKQEYLKNVITADDKFITVIHNGIDLSIIPDRYDVPIEEQRSKYNIQNDNFAIICIASICKRKNQLCLLRAINNINRTNLKVLFVGFTLDEKYYQKLKTYINENQLGDIVSFLGEQQDVFSIMRIADVLVLPSRGEGFPNVVMEAMSVSLPVIASDVSDIKYLVKDGINGYVFPDNDHNRLAELIEKMLSMEPSKRKEMGRAGRKIIEENYTIEKMVKKTEAVYEEALKRFNRI